MIGQACEFDYAGCQALKVLREDGFRTIVVNSNPATIMTDPGFADRTYLEPLDLEGVSDVLERERPDALLPTMGGQTALNLAMRLFEAGVLETLGVELIGAGVDAIRAGRGPGALPRGGQERRAERARARASSPRWTISAASRCRRSCGRRSPSAVTAAGSPRRADELRRRVEVGLCESPIGQVLVEESVRGWDEFELEVVRDRRDNVVIVCSIENLDPMGVHTGDSVTVAPQMTLSDEAYQELRDAAAAVIRAVGVETGGSNIQFARDRETGELRVIEMNPRVSRSSALASKATGYPIAKVAAKLAVGYTLDEIPNDLTRDDAGQLRADARLRRRQVPAVRVREVPRRRPHARHADEVGRRGDGNRPHLPRGVLESDALTRAGSTPGTPWQGLEDVPEGVHPWFRRELERLEGGGAAGRATGSSGVSIRARARSRPTRTTTTPRSVRATSRGRPPAGAPGGVIIGSGPNRIGQGIEFDYCCVHAALSLRELGYEAVMVNCNPETVSTDYDTSDRLYFEPLGEEEVLAVCERERPEGVVIQFGGQTPLKLARAIEAAGFRIMGTPYDAVDLAEDRERFGALLGSLGIRCPEWGIAVERARGDRDRPPDRLPGARPAVVRARRPCDAGLLPRRRGRRGLPARPEPARCSSTASSRTRSRSTSTRSAMGRRRTSPRSCSTSRRRASTPATPPASCRRRR